MKEYIIPIRNMRHKIQEQQTSSKQILVFKKDNMSSGREDFNDQDIQQTKAFLSAPQSAEKWQKDRYKQKISCSDVPQTPYLSPFNQEKNQPELNSNSIQNKYVDIEFSSIEAERTIKKKVNGENQIQENKNYLSAQQNELNMTKLYRDGIKSQIERNNLVKTQFNSRKQYALSNSFDQTQNVKKMNNFLNLEAPNMIKAAQKQKMQVKRERANQSLNGSPAGKRNHFGMAQNYSQQKNIQEQNNTININDIICQSNLKQQQPFTTTSQNATINSEFQNNSIKTIQKLNENTYQKRRPSNTDVYEFPQIIQSNKSSQSQFDRVLVSKPSMQGKATPKILQENLVNSNMNKSISNITSIKIRKKSTQLESRQLSKQEDNNSAAVRRETYSHHNSKESGNKAIQYYDETSDDLSFEGRYKQNQIFNVKQKIKLSKQSNYSGYKIFSEKEGMMIKYSPQKNQNQSEISNENSSPTYNVQTTTSNSQSNQSNRLLFNQYLQQQPVVSQISTNKTHTKLRLEEIKSVYQRQTPLNGNNLLYNQNKLLYLNKPSEAKLQNDNNYPANQPIDKIKFQNLKINTKQEDIILEDENDCTLTIKEDDKRLNGSQITHFNSPEKIKLDQSFQVFQNKQFEEDLDNWKEERQSLKKYSSSIQEENSIKTNTYFRKNVDSSIIMEDSTLQQNIQENFSSQIYEQKNNNSILEQKNQSKINTQSQNEMYNSVMQNDSSYLSNTDNELKRNSDFKYEKQKQQNSQLISLGQSTNKKNDNYNQIQDQAIKNISISQNNEDELQDNTDTNTNNNNVIDSQSLVPQQTSQILQLNNSDDLPNQFQKQNESISAYDKESSANNSLIIQSQSNYSHHKNIKAAKQEGQDKIKQSELDSTDKQKIFDQQINILSQTINNQSIQDQDDKSQNRLQQQLDSKDNQNLKQNQNSFQLQNQPINQENYDFFNQINQAQNNNLNDDDILNKLDFQTIILWENQISELNGCFKSQNATRCYNSIVNYCSQYLMLVRSRNFDNFATLFNDEKSRKIVRNQMNLEHLGIIVLLHNYLDRKTFMSNINNIRNIASYIHLNFILLTDLIISRVFQSHKQLMYLNEQDINLKTFCQNNKYPEQLINMLFLIKDIASQNIYRKKMNKIQDYLLSMKQNNEILLNLYRSATKHDKDFYNHVQNVSKIIEKSLSVEETVIQILNIFALYLTILENNIGFQPLPFLAVCPSPYLPPKEKLQKIDNNSKNNINDEGHTSNHDNIDSIIHENETIKETSPKDYLTNTQSQTQKQQDKYNLNNQNLNKQPIKQHQNTEKILNRTQRSLSKQLTKGQTNNSTNKRSVTPNSYAYSHRNTFNQLDADKKIQSPSPLVFTTGNRRKSSSLASHSSTNIKYQKEEKLTTKQFEYTLVLDLDETLVHYSETNNGGQFVIRPFANQFLQVLSEYYEIVVFTAAMPDYANWVLDNLDPNKYVTYRLFRQHAVHIGNVFIKDLSRIGRPLEKTIIIDNVADNFQLQPENGIFIKGWFSDPSDTALVELLPLLKEIATKKVPDVRKALKNLKEQMIQNIQNGIQNPHLNLKLD